MKDATGSAPQAEQRRLAAIMFTDIVGFSRQMGTDEARMLRLLDVHNQIIQQAVAVHQGMVIKTVGDAFLVDFPSVVHAVQCAQQIQAQFRSPQRREGEKPNRFTSASAFIPVISSSARAMCLAMGSTLPHGCKRLAEPDTICISGCGVSGRCQEDCSGHGNLARSAQAEEHRPALSSLRAPP